MFARLLEMTQDHVFLGMTYDQRVLVTEKDQELKNSNKLLTEKDQELKNSNKLLTENNQELKNSNKLLTEKDQELKNSNKLLLEKDQELKNSNKLLTEKDQELKNSNKLLLEKDQELDKRNKLLTDTDSQLKRGSKLLTEKDNQLEDSIKLLTDKDNKLQDSIKLLTEKDKQLNQSDEELKMRKREWDDVISENKQLAQQICDLKTELEKLKTESDQKTERGYTSTAGPKLQIRRWSINIPPGKHGENTDSTLPLRRTRSMPWNPPDLGAEAADEVVSLPVMKRRRSKSPPPDMAADNTLDSPVSPSMSELRLVLLGRTVAVRNAAGNTILGREVFGAEASSSDLSQKSRRREGDVCGRRLVLVDAPDLSGRSQEDTRQDAGLLVRLSAPGPHAFLLVIPAEASGEEARGTMEKMQEAFGESCWEHSMVILIRADGVRERAEEFLHAGSRERWQLVEKCGNRCHVLNVTDGSDAAQVSQLLEKIESMVAGNTESFYSTQTYQEVEAQVREMERKIQRDLEERRHVQEQEMRERFEKELKDSLRKMEGAIQEHEGDIRKIDCRTSELERQVREERDEEKKRELEEELRRESERREEMERKLGRFRAKRENERGEREERHRQDIEEMRETYEAEARVEAERNLMKVLLPEIQRNIMISTTKMQREFNRRLEEKNREMTTLRQTLKESHSCYSVLEEVYHNSLEKRLKVLDRLPSGGEGQYL